MVCGSREDASLHVRSAHFGSRRFTNTSRSESSTRTRYEMGSGETPVPRPTLESIRPSGKAEGRSFGPPVFRGFFTSPGLVYGDALRDALSRPRGRGGGGAVGSAASGVSLCGSSRRRGGHEAPFRYRPHALFVGGYDPCAVAARRERDPLRETVVVRVVCEVHAPSVHDESYVFPLEFRLGVADYGSYRGDVRV